MSTSTDDRFMVWFVKDGKTLVGTGSGTLRDYIKAHPELWDKDVQIVVRQFGHEKATVGPYIIKNPTPQTPPVCPPGQHWDPAQGICVPDVVTPPSGEVLYDSKIHSKLHDGIVRTVEKEGNISAGGLGLECRASGNPKITVNADGTFSLICGSGHGRFYGYCRNYNATLEIECAFWNSAPGQDLSLKMRSRHNEPDPSSNRFGGYGVSIDRSGWGAKREQFHNEHSQSTSGSLPTKPETQKYFKIEFTVKDEGPGVRQIGKMNGTQFMSKIDNSPEAYMRNQVLYAAQSYFWVRSNIDSGSGEIRIKSLRILKA